MASEKTMAAKLWIFIKNHQQWIGFLIVISAMLYAYFAVLFESRKWFMDIIYFLFFVFLVLGLYRAFRMEREEIKRIQLVSWEGLFVVGGVILTYIMIHFGGISSVLASSFIGLMGYFFIRKYEVAIYCGSFAGMVSGAMINIFEALLLAVICAFIYLLSKPLFKGYGGKLGTIAFMASLIAFGIFNEQYLIVSSDFHFWTLLLVSVAGVVITFYFHHGFHMSAVFSSAMTSFIFALLFTYAYPQYIEYAVVFFSASFIGMSDEEKLPTWYCVLISGLVLGLIYYIFVEYFHGLGGKLGLMALISVIISTAISAVVKRLFNKTTILDKGEQT